MARGRLGAEQIVTKLRQIEVLQGQGRHSSFFLLIGADRRSVKSYARSFAHEPSLPPNQAIAQAGAQRSLSSTRVVKPIE